MVWAPARPSPTAAPMAPPARVRPPPTKAPAVLMALSRFAASVAMSLLVSRCWSSSCCQWLVRFDDGLPVGNGMGVRVTVGGAVAFGRGGKREVQDREQREDEGL